MAAVSVKRFIWCFISGFSLPSIKILAESIGLVAFATSVEHIKQHQITTSTPLQLLNNKSLLAF